MQSGKHLKSDVGKVISGEMDYFHMVSDKGTMALRGNV